MMWGKAFGVIALSMIAGLLVPVVQAANVESVRLWRAPDHTRLVFDLNGAIDHKLFTLTNPTRLVVDLKGAYLNTSVENLPLDNTPIKSIRTAAQGGHLRVVLDLSAAVQPKSFFLRKHGNNRDRVVLDLYDQVQVVEKTVQEAVQNRSGQRDIIIAIDAGHGGEDPGALGPKVAGRNLREKDVVLAISRELAAIINREPGYRAELVRTGDYYIPLGRRRDIAREKRADLFVSIHADAFHNPRARGASVFALSRSGATSETARFLAQKENEADLIGGVGSVSLGDKDEMLRGVLVDLSMTATLGTSLQVGEKVLGNMGRVARLHKTRVEQAGFLVLKSPDVPSILVETGFISNPDEATKLNSSYYRGILTKAIFTGIKSHFEFLPPAGTLIAARKQSGGFTRSGDVEHIITSGETLSGIARRYDVSVNDILRVNSMNGSVIRVGQKLKIPAS